MITLYFVDKPRSIFGSWSSSSLFHSMKRDNFVIWKWWKNIIFHLFIAWNWNFKNLLKCLCRKNLLTGIDIKNINFQTKNLELNTFFFTTFLFFCSICNLIWKFIGMKKCRTFNFLSLYPCHTGHTCLVADFEFFIFYD